MTLPRLDNHQWLLLITYSSAFLRSDSLLKSHPVARPMTSPALRPNLTTHPWRAIFERCSLPGPPGFPLPQPRSPPIRSGHQPPPAAGLVHLRPPPPGLVSTTISPIGRVLLPLLQPPCAVDTPHCAVTGNYQLLAFHWQCLRHPLHPSVCPCRPSRSTSTARRRRRSSRRCARRCGSSRWARRGRCARLFIFLSYFQGLDSRSLKGFHLCWCSRFDLSCAWSRRFQSLCSSTATRG